jgi:hypothetical protein
MSPLPGFPAGPLWREIPITRAFLYIIFRVPSKGAPLQFALTECPYALFLESSNYLSDFPVNDPLPPLILNGAPMERGARLQCLLLKSLVDESLAPERDPQGD